MAMGWEKKIFMTLCPRVGWVVGIESLRNQTKRKVYIWVKFKESLRFGVGGSHLYL